jgi:hypothetical protein
MKRASVRDKKGHAEKMPTNQSANTMHNDAAAIATLNIRVTGIEGRVGELSNTVNSVQTALSTKIDSITTSLGSKIDERGKTPWQYIISGLAVIFSLYAYIDNSKIGPLKEKDADLTASVKEMSHNIRENMVPAWIHNKEWGYRDQRFKEFDERMKFGESAMLDRVKRLEDQFGSTWNLRDAINGVQTRIDRLEHMRSPSEKAQ